MQNKIKFLGFIICAILIFVGLNFFLNSPNLDSSWAAFQKIPNNSIEILFLGNSRVYNTFQPKIIEDVVQTQSFVLGLPNDSIQIMVFELEKIIKSQKPNLIIIDKYSLEIYPEISMNHISPFVTQLNIFERIKFYQNSSIEKLYNSYPLLLFHASLVKDPTYFINQFLELRINNKNSKIIQDLDINKGFRFIETLYQNWENRYIDGVQNNSKKQSLDNLEAFDRFMKICEENNIQVIVVSTQSFSNPKYTEGNISKININDLLKKYNFQYYDFAKQLPLDWFDFTNSSHYSSIGALKITINFIEKILPDYGYSINNNIMRYYKEIAIDQYNIQVNKENLNIDLLPNITSENIKYSYRCIGKQTKIIVDENSVKPEFICKYYNNDTYQIIIELEHSITNYKYKNIYEISVP